MGTMSTIRAMEYCPVLSSLPFESRIPVEQVDSEPLNSIVPRVVTGAMPYGLISMETHSTLAVAMNHWVESQTSKFSASMSDWRAETKAKRTRLAELRKARADNAARRRDASPR